MEEELDLEGTLKNIQSCMAFVNNFVDSFFVFCCCSY